MQIKIYICPKFFGYSNKSSVGTRNYLSVVFLFFLLLWLFSRLFSSIVVIELCVMHAGSMKKA